MTTKNREILEELKELRKKSKQIIYNKNDEIAYKIELKKINDTLEELQNQKMDMLTKTTNKDNTRFNFEIKDKKKFKCMF